MKRLVTLTTLFAVTALGVVTTADAGPWQRNHPWRTADNGRLANQNYRIRQGVRDGQISHAQAHTLRADDRSIRAEERADASVNGSHLTRADQRQIHAQENADSRDIYAARHQ